MDSGSECYRRFLEGDKNALAEIIRDNKDGMIFFLNGFCGNYAVAEDMTQETFIKLYVKKPKFHGKASFKTWLYRIARNTAVDYLRKNGRAESNFDTDYSDFAQNPEIEYFKEENTIQLHKSLCKLRSEYRQILWLIYFEGMSIDDASKILGKSKNNISVLLHRAKNSLKSELEKEGFSYENI